MTALGGIPHRHQSREEHAVHFYEDEARFIDEVAGFIADGLQGGDRAIVIATEAHRRQIERHVRKAVPHIEASPFYRNQFLILDAQLTMAAFMIDGWPDERRFNQTVGALVHRAAQAGCGRIFAFGEMVALLVAEGNTAAAIRLEELWNALARHYSFSLLCAYPAKLLREDSEAYARICEQHDRICQAD